ncbi:MAG: hypothetical protein P4K83_02270 [Terracidiphilus sp.]|nr:hypothetical protein [Terracidiphilus sp.]
MRKIFRRGDKPCFADGCTERVSRYVLMCPHHWALVPNSLQYAVYNTYEIWRRGGSPRLWIDTIREARAKVAQREKNPQFFRRSH